MSDRGFGDFEFERRFYVRELPPEVVREPDPDLIIQNYYMAEGGYALRLRVQASSLTLDPADMGNELAALDQHADAFDFCAMTVKGPMIGGTRYEAEREIDVNVGLNMIRLGEARIIKNRFSLWLGQDGWVIDVFASRNRPLIIAECERGGPVTDLRIPDFCLTEVTDDHRFSNEALANRPFGAWAAEFEQELSRNGPRFLQNLGENVLEGDLRRPEPGRRALRTPRHRGPQ
ncbi:hypothetical protein LWF01_07880 [Saxibacter everestensis]|uniref:CYTH domain-containing protein n=1 Tax=Saxibacter everestensis TaxID=2909229 RepID=A0ABY8QXD4_9MICO|nr:hypothetical protein LWF01_07880 [Brevibacteriaceae bacterium ZFBP1038]